MAADTRTLRAGLPGIRSFTFSEADRYENYPRYSRLAARVLCQQIQREPQFCSSEAAPVDGACVLMVVSDHVISIAANDLWRERLVSRSVEHEKCSAMVNVPDQAIFSPRGRTRTDDRVVLF